MRQCATGSVMGQYGSSNVLAKGLDVNVRPLLVPEISRFFGSIPFF